MTPENTTTIQSKSLFRVIFIALISSSIIVLLSFTTTTWGFTAASPSPSPSCRSPFRSSSSSATLTTQIVGPVAIITDPRRRYYQVRAANKIQNRISSTQIQSSSLSSDNNSNDDGPQYNRYPGILSKIEKVGKGSFLLTIDSVAKDSSDDDDDDDKNTRRNDLEYNYYQPGHVLALEILPPAAADAKKISKDDVSQSSSSSSSSSSTSTTPKHYTIMNEKTRKDLENNNGWLRGPYTVSRSGGGGGVMSPLTIGGSSSSSSSSNKFHFQILIKEVGYKSHVIASSIPGTTAVRFGGKFKVPIVDGILNAAAATATNNTDSSDSQSSPPARNIVDGRQDDSQDLILDWRNSTERVVLISTGVGVGPCVGAVEELLLMVRRLNEEEETFAGKAHDDGDNRSVKKMPPSLLSSIKRIDLIASFRTEEEIAMKDDLDRLVELSSSFNQQTNNGHEGIRQQFTWQPVITNKYGRLSESREMLEKYLDLTDSSTNDMDYVDCDTICSVKSTHYHLIGNGQLVNEWKEALSRAGVPAERVTTETYFNHKEEPNEHTIDRIASYIKSRCIGSTNTTAITTTRQLQPTTSLASTIPTSSSSTTTESSCNVLRFRCRVTYDGTAFSGFQLQNRTPPPGHPFSAKANNNDKVEEVSSSRSPSPRTRTVQGVLEQALSQRFGLLAVRDDPATTTTTTETTTTGQRYVKVVGAGRTDAGVHARGQAIHFDVPILPPTLTTTTPTNFLSKLLSYSSSDNYDTAETIHKENELELLSQFEYSVNQMLPSDVRIWNVQRCGLISAETEAVSSSSSSSSKTTTTTTTATAIAEATRIDDGRDHNCDVDDDGDLYYNKKCSNGNNNYHSNGKKSTSMTSTQTIWHAMKDSIGKLYVYRLALGPSMDPIHRYNRWQYDWGYDVDIPKLQATLHKYVGTHDFVCFSGALERNERKTGLVKTTTRTVTRCELVPDHEDDNHGHDGNVGQHNTMAHHSGMYRIEIQLDGALYKMVRNMVSTALDVSRGWMDERIFDNLLYHASEQNLTRSDNPCKPAPPSGLTLEHVYYYKDLW